MAVLTNLNKKRSSFSGLIKPRLFSSQRRPLTATVQFCCIIMGIMACMLGPAATGGTTTGPGPPGGHREKDDDNRILYIVVVLVIVSPAGAVLICLCCRCICGGPSTPKQGILEFSTVNVVSYPPDAGVGFGATNCSICQGRFGEGERVSVLPICRHIHHPQCLQNRMNSSGLYCPDCRQDYSFWDDGARPSPGFLP